LLGIPLRGLTSTRRWLVVDTLAPHRGASGQDFAAADFEFGCDPRRPWVHGPLPAGTHRWEFMLAPAEDPGELERPEVVRRLLASYSGGWPAKVLRANVYTFHARVATRWRAGRVFLLDDAAHLASPFAGQGLSAGLRDAASRRRVRPRRGRGRAGALAGHRRMDPARGVEALCYSPARRRRPYPPPAGRPAPAAAHGHRVGRNEDATR
jgi:hypothetical protein